MQVTSPQIMLSPHFSLAEFCVSDSAARLGINNTPSQPMIHNLERTAEMLERVRALLGNKSIIVKSGYRTYQLNEFVGGSKNSAHMRGLAADFICPKFGNPRDICNAIVANGKIPFDQLIYEYGQWVHIGLTDLTPRGQILTIDKYGTRHGLHAIRG